MAFFGITTLGPREPVADKIAVNQEREFHQIPIEQYWATFDKYLLGDSPTARTLEIDGSENILRASLGDMLRELLGRQPRKHELDAWFTFCDFDRSATMGRDEYFKAVTALKQFSESPQQPKAYTSFEKFHTNWVRHTRVGYELQNTQRGPMTANQEIGWHALKPAPPTKSFPLNRTDVSINEGRNPASYYGHFLA